MADPQKQNCLLKAGICCSLTVCEHGPTYTKQILGLYQELAPAEVKLQLPRAGISFEDKGFWFS